MNHIELYRVKHVRDDGWLSELISLKYKDSPFNFHSYIVSILPEKARANHYHKTKEEWLAIASGKIALFLENINTNEKQRIILDIDDNNYRLIHIPPFIAHTVKNIGNSAATVVVFSTTVEDKDDIFEHEVKE